MISGSGSGSDLARQLNPLRSRLNPWSQHNYDVQFRRQIKSTLDEIEGKEAKELFFQQVKMLEKNIDCDYSKSFFGKEFHRPDLARHLFVVPTDEREEFVSLARQLGTVIGNNPRDVISGVGILSRVPVAERNGDLLGHFEELTNPEDYAGGSTHKVKILEFLVKIPNQEMTADLMTGIKQLRSNWNISHLIELLSELPPANRTQDFCLDIKEIVLVANYRFMEDRGGSCALRDNILAISAERRAEFVHRAAESIRAEHAAGVDLRDGSNFDRITNIDNILQGREARPIPATRNPSPLTAIASIEASPQESGDGYKVEIEGKSYDISNELGIYLEDLIPGTYLIPVEGDPPVPTQDGGSLVVYKKNDLQTWHRTSNTCPQTRKPFTNVVEIIIPETVTPETS